MRFSPAFMTRVARADRIRLALCGLCILGACRRTPTPSRVRTDASTAARDARTDRDVNDTGPEPFGPPNPWGDGSLPPSSATGPEAERTLTAMTALRASIGFWRIERSQHDRCPTLDDLAHTPSAAFDPTTMRTDAWGSPFEIECQGARVRVRSLGPDRARETADDLWAQ